MTARTPSVLAALGAAALLASAPARAAADDPGPEPPRAETGGGHGPLGLVVHAGAFQGFGGGLQLGADAVGVRGSVGWEPHLFAVQRAGGGVDLAFRGSLLVAPDLYVRVFHPGPRTHVGLQAGYRHSALLGGGVAAGLYVQFGAGPRYLDCIVSGGVIGYPDGPERARRELGAPGASFFFPGPAVTAGVSFGLGVFP